jgi:regulator of cell morphogenesis and NO signaling
MKNITPETPVGEIVRAFPARSRIFENLGIDYCCGGKQSLAEACRRKGLDPATAVAMLSALDRGERVVADPDTLTLTELCDHIERVHHGYLREELPRLDFMTRKVAATHGDAEPQLLEVRRVFETFSEKVSAHGKEEEEQVFPAIRQLEAAENGGKAETVSALKSEFDKLESEHKNTGAALAQFKQLTNNYTAPDWACNTLGALYDGLHRMERDMHQHIHEENNVLFPRVLALF